MDRIRVAVTALIDEQLKAKDRPIVAIDGRCASVMTTLAGSLQRHYGCNLIHMDHFFLHPEQRTPERLHTPGENVDHERFLEGSYKCVPKMRYVPKRYRSIGIFRVEDVV